MGARGSTGAAHSPTGTELLKGYRMRGSEAGEKKKESEPLINILIRSESRAVRFVSLTIMIFRHNAAASTKFRMSNITRVYTRKTENGLGS